MKNSTVLTLLLLSLCTFGFTTAKGISGNSASASTKTVETVVNKLKMAERSAHNFSNGVAIVTFTVDAGGQLQGIETNTPNQEIQKFLNSELQTINLPDHSYRAGEVHTLRITFKTL